jgi:hypothetical protein
MDIFHQLSENPHGHFPPTFRESSGTFSTNIERILRDIFHQLSEDPQGHYPRAFRGSSGTFFTNFLRILRDHQKVGEKVLDGSLVHYSTD